jgi:hypothetical protein
MGDTYDFHKLAEKARQMAVNARKPEDKASWLLLAEDWLRLAQDADGLLGRPRVEK